MEAGSDKLLLIDSDPELLARTASALARVRPSISIETSTELEAALERVATQPFAAVLVALGESDAPRFDAVRRLRTVSPETPLLVLADLPEVVERALALGAHAGLGRVGAAPEALEAALVRAQSKAEAEAHATELAFYDALTGLFTARYFLERLRESVALSVREGKPCAVLLVGLSGLDEAEAAHGPKVALAGLRELASRLRDALREYDTVARIAGDSFAVLVQGLDDRNVLGGVSQRVLELFEKPVRVSTLGLELGASIGVAVAPECAQEPGLLLRVAERAQHAAGLLGSGSVRFALGPSSESSLSTSLGVAPPRSALRLFLHSQEDAQNPRAFAHRVEISMPEDPERSTADVLRSLARVERDVELVVESLARALRETPPDDEVSVMLPGELFGTRLLDALREGGVMGASRRVVFEVQAAALLAGSASLQVMLETLQDAGFRIAMRDYGSAPMRPDLLAALPLGSLRLEPRLVTRASEGGSAARLLSGLVAFGQALGFEVTVDELRTDVHCQIALAAGVNHVRKRHAVSELGDVLLR